MHSPFLIHRKFLPMNQNAPRGCAARGDEVYAEHTARARKCATGAHFILIEIIERIMGHWLR
jgi:hypothetical protein